MNIDKVYMKKLRFGTPSGNIWIYPDKPKEYNTELPAPYTCQLGQVSSGYGLTVKYPMLIVGANNYVRENIPFFIIQKYDVHLVFMPTSKQVYQLGALIVNRTEYKYMFVSLDSINITDAMNNIFLAITRETYNTVDDSIECRWNTQHPKLMVWLNNWIYRCHKISLKDVLHLEPYNNKESA